MDAGNYFTIEEIKRNNGEDGNKLWILIDGKVYDVTDYKHPGGREFLEDNIGEDRHEEFEAQGHSQAARNELKKFFIGHLKHDPNNPVKSKNQTDTPKKQNQPGLLFPLVVLVIIIYICYNFILKQ
jgi:cytochrome b involved in lipid metabolism